MSLPPTPPHPSTTPLPGIEPQPHFMPGCAPRSHEGDAVVAGGAAPVATRAYPAVAATQAWHPPGDASFASSHPGRAPFETIELHGHPPVLWPDHCVQGTPGAALDARVDWHAADLILRKGTNPQVDSYSAFRENFGPDGERPLTGLAGWLRERGIDEVHLCGLARDYCVLWSAQDAVAAGLRARVLWDLTRPVAPDGDAPTRAALDAAGIAV